jgi:acyl-CoA synthetase (AMP-forming)/AMP-acid ligase II
MRSCGRPVTNVVIRVVDSDGNDMPTGEVGEIICKTPQIMKGYWNLPEETARAIRGEWFYTGDAGFLDADGYVYIHDRVKDMIVSGGENVYPAEVESALFGHPAIADVAVIGVPDDTWGEAVKAVVVKKPGAEVTPEEIIAFARERIAGYKVPKSVDFAETLPRNPSGKILKRELRTPYWAGRARQVN